MNGFDYFLYVCCLCGFLKCCFGFTRLLAFFITSGFPPFGIMDPNTECELKFQPGVDSRVA